MEDEEREAVEQDVMEEEPRGWIAGVDATEGTVYIETGRGQTTQVQAGAPFQETVERVADEVHYGGYFRVFLNGEELINPEEAPETIEPGMRIALTSYDKVG